MAYRWRERWLCNSVLSVCLATRPRGSTEGGGPHAGSVPLLPATRSQVTCLDARALESVELDAMVRHGVSR